MDRIVTFLAKSGSSSKPYHVTFTIKDGRLSVECDCQAGKFGQYCKHKFGLLKGNSYWLYDEYDEDQHAALQEVSKWAQKSDFWPYIIEGSKLQRIIDEAEANMKDFRAKLAQAMKKGLPIQTPAESSQK